LLPIARSITEAIDFHLRKLGSVPAESFVSHC